MSRSPENTLIEQQQPQEKFEDFFENVKFLSSNLDSNMTSDFTEYLGENEIKFEDYFLANLFLSVIANKELPEQSAYKYFDTKDNKIEKFVESMVINTQEKAS
ncbi:MAG: hypothetical protein WC933_02415 [Candidatus Paceibacterota bacterium]|jgi:hypothetical protein